VCGKLLTIIVSIDVLHCSYILGLCLKFFRSDKIVLVGWVNLWLSTAR